MGGSSISARPVVLAVALTVGALTAGCGGKPFDVKPVPDVRSGTFDTHAEASGITVQAETIRDEDYLYETFDANLILAGVLPVRIRLSNTTEQPVDMSKAKFELRTARGERIKADDAKKAFKRLVSFYGISTYSKSGYKESRSDFSSYALETDEPLAPGDSRQGLVFFCVPGLVERSSEDLTLVARRLNRQSRSDSEVRILLR